MAKRGPQVFQISGARTGLTEDVRARQRRYIISMSVRTVAVVLAVVLWNVERPLAWVMLVAGLLLPYVAVVAANAGRGNGSASPHSYVPPAVVPELDAPAEGAGDEPGTAPAERAPEPVAEP
jgi:hypothetical protein